MCQPDRREKWDFPSLVVGFLVCGLLCGIGFIIYDKKESFFPAPVKAEIMPQVTEEYRNLWRASIDGDDILWNMSETDEEIMALGISKSRVLYTAPEICREVLPDRWPVGVDYYGSNPGASGYLLVVASVDTSGTFTKAADYIIYYYEPSGYFYRIEVGSTFKNSTTRCKAGSTDWRKFEDPAKVEEIKKGLLRLMKPDVEKGGDSLKPERHTNPDAAEFLGK